MPERHRGADIANGYFDFMGVAMSALGCDFNREVSITVDVLSVHQTELSRDCGRIIVIASLDNHTVSHAHNTAIAGFHSAPSWWKCAQTGMQGTRLSAAINKLYNRPVILHDDVDDLDFAIWKGLAPSVVVTLVALAAWQKLASGHVFEMAILGDHSSATFRIP